MYIYCGGGEGHLFFLYAMSKVCLSIRPSSELSSCSCCIDPCVKIQGDPLRADWLSGKSGMRCNSVRGEQITPYLENKALIQKSKIIDCLYKYYMVSAGVGDCSIAFMLSVLIQ